MKILLRNHGDKYYVWKDATYENGEYYVDGNRIVQVNILALKGDDRAKYVQCNSCGTIMVDDPAVIEKHFADEEAKKDCAKCTYRRYSNQVNNKITMNRNEDGTYHITSIFDANVFCGAAWPQRAIHDAAVNNSCMFYRCRREGVKSVQDIFMKNPSLFDKHITVDFLKAKGFAYEGYKNGYFIYDLKLRGTLKACVNEIGIVDHFLITYKYRSYNVYYSEKYNELFYEDHSKYTNWVPDGVSPSKNDAVKTKITALYKEANAE